LDSDNWKDAREFFEKALAADPQWILALEGYQSCPPDSSPTIPQFLVMPPLSMMKTYLAVVDNAIRNQADEDKRKEAEMKELEKSGGHSH
jgi:hypothetical protein